MERSLVERRADDVESTIFQGLSMGERRFEVPSDLLDVVQMRLALAGLRVLAHNDGVVVVC